LHNQKAKADIDNAARSGKAGVVTGQKVLLIRQPKRENCFSPFGDKANLLSAEAQALEWQRMNV